jgi:hypothetical protein
MGVNAGMDFVNFLKLSEKVDIDELLKKPSLIKKYNTGDVGLIYSICVNLVDRASSIKDVANVFKVMEELGIDEYAIFIVNGMIGKVGAFEAIKLLRELPQAQAQTMKLLSNIS